jgi:hypothetical protein
MKTSLSKSKRKNDSMKDTHTVQDLENLMFDYAQRIKSARTKTEKTELLRELKAYERQWNNVSDKHINGKKYPVKKIPKDTPKEELYKLIDDVETLDPLDSEMTIQDGLDQYGRDLSGVSPNKNRFEFVEKGW